MKVIHLDRDGKVIPDITKITLPYDLSADIWEILNPDRKAVRVRRTQEDAKDRS